jgi:hypothetical protein
MLRTLTTTLVALAVLGATGGSVMAVGERSRPSVVVGSSSFGRVLFDGRGFVLYGFTAIRVAGACAQTTVPRRGRRTS